MKVYTRRYKVVKGTFEGLVFYGHEYNGRVFDDATTGRSYPKENCVLCQEVV